MVGHLKWGNFAFMGHPQKPNPAELRAAPKMPIFARKSGAAANSPILPPRVSKFCGNVLWHPNFIFCFQVVEVGWLQGVPRGLRKTFWAIFWVLAPLLIIKSWLNEKMSLIKVATLMKITGAPLMTFLWFLAISAPKKGPEGKQLSTSKRGIHGFCCLHWGRLR